MTKPFKLINFFDAELLAQVGPEATSFSLSAGDLEEFDTDYFSYALIVTDGLVEPEIVWVTGKIGGALVVERGKEGTIARNWLAGTRLVNALTSATVPAGSGGVGTSPALDEAVAQAQLAAASADGSAQASFSYKLLAEAFSNAAGASATASQSSRLAAEAATTSALGYMNGAELAQGEAVTAKAAAEIARDDAVVARTSALAAQSSATASANLAATSQVGAANSATAAANSATTASSQASLAAASATASETSRLAAVAASGTANTNAATATNAATNAVSAKTSAETAAAQAASSRDLAVSAAASTSGQATAAANSATSASASASAAAISATASDTSRINAQTAQSGAQSARDTAVSARDTAVAAAATATSQASLATTSANNSGTSASAAATSASNASTSASNAAASAASATTNANTASTKAGEAATSASSAATSAALADASTGALATQLNTVSAQVGTNTSNIALNATALATLQGAAAIYEILVNASGGNPAVARFMSGLGGSEISFAAKVISLLNSVNGSVIEIMRAVEGEAFFSRPISSDAEGRRVTIGPGFGITGSKVVLWFGPATTDPDDQSRTNGYFALGTDGKIYYGASELTSGVVGSKQAIGADDNGIASVGWADLVTANMTDAASGYANFRESSYNPLSWAGPQGVFQLRLVRNSTVLWTSSIFMGVTDFGEITPEWADVNNELAMQTISVTNGPATYRIQGQRFSGAGVIYISDARLNVIVNPS